MRQTLSVVVILSCVCTLNAQDNAVRFAPGVAVPRAWSILMSALDAADLQEQLAAVSALSIIDTPEALDLLERVARTASEPVRCTALWYLPTNSSHDYLPLVADALQDPSSSVRRAAVQRLSSFNDS